MKQDPLFDSDENKTLIAICSRRLNRDRYEGQQPPDFLIFAARASSAWSSRTSVKHLPRHSNSLR